MGLRCIAQGMQRVGVGTVLLPRGVLWQRLSLPMSPTPSLLPWSLLVGTSLLVGYIEVVVYFEVGVAIDGGCTVVACL